MASIISLLRRIGGAKAAPATGSAGQLALWKAGAKPTDAVSLYAHDGTQWTEVLDTSAQWTASGANVYRAAGSVGIGAAPRADKHTILDIAGDIWAWTINSMYFVVKSKNPTIDLIATQGTADKRSFRLQATNGLFHIASAPDNGGTTVNSPFTMTFDGDIGIGQVAPKAKLEVNANSANPAVLIKQYGTGDCLRIEDEGNPDATPFVVDQNGSVGIGIAAPVAPLDVLLPGGVSRMLLTKSATGALITAANAANNAEADLSLNGHIIRLQTLNATRLEIDNAGAVGLHVAANPDMALRVRGKSVAPTEYSLWVENSTPAVSLAVNNSGNVGIGGTPAAARLSVHGPTGGASLSLTDGVNSTLNVNHDGIGNITFEGPFASVFRWKTQNVVQLTLNAGGQVFTPGTYAVTGTGSQVHITSAGQLVRASSSIKYKKDVEPLDAALTDKAIRELRPVWYRTKNPTGDDKADWSHIGLIAEDVAKVEKRLVKYKTAEVSSDDDGNPVVTPLETPEPEDVDYARLSVLLLAKVQQLETRLAKLEARP